MLEVARTARSVGAITFVGLLLPFLFGLAAGTLQPIELMRVGEQSPAAPLAIDQYGPESVSKGDAGYDGAFFWAVADQLPDFDAAARYVDDAPYRFQRILPSAIASLAGGGDRSAISLVLLSLAGAALCTAALADLALRHGRPAWVGFLALIPLAFSLGYSTGEPLAFGLGLLGLCCADRRQHVAAVALITLGALARESVVVFGLGVGLGLLVELMRSRPRENRAYASIALYGLPLAVSLAWAAYLRARFDSVDKSTRIDVLGILDAGAWGILLGVAIFALGLLGAWRWRDVPVVWGTSLGFATGILLYYGDLFILRALPRVSAPAIALGLASLAARRPDARMPAASGDAPLA